MSRENLARGLSKSEVAGLRQEAWLGDAVLELYVRDRILKEEAAMNDTRRVSLVRNSFLNQLGQPTRVEAEIGRRYREGGLEAAFAWIEEQMGPLVLKVAERTNGPSHRAAAKKRPRKH